MMHFMNILPLALTIALLPINFAFGADAPVYKDGLLTIPSVNTAEQVGHYQDVTFKLTEQGTWQLLSYKAIGSIIGNSNLGLAPIQRVDVVKTNTFPVQVFLRVSGSFSDGCPHMGQINQRLENNRFDITIASQYIYPYGPCPAIEVPFVKTIPLAAYGLSAGIYSYNVNYDDNPMIGSFELKEDNKYPGDYLGYN